MTYPAFCRPCRRAFCARNAPISHTPRALGGQDRGQWPGCEPGPSQLRHGLALQAVPERAVTIGPAGLCRSRGPSPPGPQRTVGRQGAGTTLGMAQEPPGQRQVAGQPNRTLRR